MPVRLTVTASGAGAEKLREVARRLPDRVGETASQMGERTQERLKESAPVSRQVPGGRKPGGLRESIRFDMEGTTATFAASEVAEYVIGGTVPHEIRPRNAQALHFWWEVAGGYVNLMRVQHPGTSPNDFRVPALAAAAGDAEEALNELADRILEGLA